MRRLARRSLAAVAGMVLVTAAVADIAGTDSSAFLYSLLATVAVLLGIAHVVQPAIDRRDRGAKGEEQVGALLDGLASQGWRTIHDASLGRGNVDHILVGPGGLLTVETKSHGGVVKANRIDRRWLNQAYAQRKCIERVTQRRVDALLVFSRGYVKPAVSRQRGVLVLSARMLADHLARRPATLTPDEVRSVHDRLSRALLDRD